jgi:predicted nucleic acid-binding protein
LSRFVLDASVTLGWIADDPRSSPATHVMERLLEGDRAVVPALWHLELANWFVLAQRRNVLTAEAADRGIAAIEEIIVRAVDTETEFHIRRSRDLATTFQLSSYDAAYLDLALRDGLPLATLDRPLRAAATKAGVDLLL